MSPNAQAESRPPASDWTVDVVVPVYNEEAVLLQSISRLRSYLDLNFPLPSIVTIVDNASTDQTSRLARKLSDELGGVRTIRLADKGRGGAIRAAWTRSQAPIVAYMDADLSTSLEALLPLVTPLVSGECSLAIGSRLAPGARVVRSRRRELTSRVYNFLLKQILGMRVFDAQCGFKAARAVDVVPLLAEVEDNDWFFDTELLVAAQRHGLRITEIPVVWVENRDSSVRILKTAVDDVRGVLRLRHKPSPSPSSDKGRVHIVDSYKENQEVREVAG